MSDLDDPQMGELTHPAHRIAGPADSKAARLRSDVEDEIARLRLRLGYLEALVIQWRRQEGEVMERPARE